jgi:hypothetical protein
MHATAEALRIEWRTSRPARSTTRYVGISCGLIIALASTWVSTTLLRDFTYQRAAFLAAMSLQAGASALTFAVLRRSSWFGICSAVGKLAMALGVAGVWFPVCLSVLVAIASGCYPLLSAQLGIDVGMVVLEGLVILGAALVLGLALLLGLICLVVGLSVVVALAGVSITHLVRRLDQQFGRPIRSAAAYGREALGRLWRLGRLAGLAVVRWLALGRGWRILISSFER